MELELGLAPPTAHLELSCSSDSSSGSGKRAFQETLPLFDDGNKKKKQQLVGWPPVSSTLRSRACGAANNYVKVKKQGEAIGRKVDLSVLASYDDLVAALERMFPATNDQSGTVLTC
jgi:auxin-responsive protein IAA